MNRPAVVARPHREIWRGDNIRNLWLDRLAFIGKRVVWGPGRHGPGRNLFTYIPDPDNTIVEGYADLLQVYDDASYVPIDWSTRGEGALNLWGPMPPHEWPDYGVPILAPVLGALAERTSELSAARPSFQRTIPAKLWAE